MKKVQVFGDEMKEIALKEVEILKEVSSSFNTNCIPSLVCFYDYHIEKDTLYIEMEYIEGVTLDKFAEKLRSSPKLNKYLLAIIKDIIQALQKLNSYGIIHRDVKPENIMINSNYQPKLIDIGLACKTNKGCSLSDKNISCCKGIAGTPYYSSPESLLDNIFYYVSDIYSLGASIYFASTGKVLFDPNPKNLNALKKLVETEKVPSLNTVNIQLNNLVNKMLIYNPDLRITSEEIMDSNYRLWP